MRKSLWLLLILTRLAWGEIGHEFARALRGYGFFYQGCLENVRSEYCAGYRAFDVFAFLAHPGDARMRLKTSAGVMETTGNPLDLALEGDGYFVFANGLLARSGTFLHHRGKLTSLEGYQLLGSGDLPLQATALQIAADGQLSWILQNGDGKRVLGGKLALGRVPHPAWLEHRKGYLGTTAASGPVQLDAPHPRVLSGQLELCNATSLEQQKTAQALLVFAGLRAGPASSHPQRAREDLLQVMAEHDQLYRACLENLRHQTDAGYRASDIFARRGGRLRLKTTQGPLRETKSPYTIAIDGDGYFLLEGGKLSRCGSFQMNKDGELVLLEGGRLLGYADPERQESLQVVHIPADMSNLELKGDGTLMGTRLNGSGRPEWIAQIPLARVGNEGWMTQNRALLDLTPETGSVLPGVPGRDGLGVVFQGYLESSNLSAFEQIKMLHALRNYAQLLGMPLFDEYQP